MFWAAGRVAGCGVGRGHGVDENVEGVLGMEVDKALYIYMVKHKNLVVQVGHL